MLFEWHLDDPPPIIEPTSKAKLDVVRSYLSAYFDRLNVNPSRETFKIDLIDGFAGGGTFRDGDEVIEGSPLIMLREAHDASERLNRGRIKPLNFDCRFHFIDIEKAHTDHLRRVLDERGYQVEGGEIVIHNSPFRDVADRIIQEVTKRQPRAGRAIFFLDQTGFSHVDIALIARIFSALPAAEVILTLAADSLINHLAERPQLIKAVKPLEVTDAQIHELLAYKSGSGGRALVQRTLIEHIRRLAGATFDTPFFIRPRVSRRAMWFLHLSRHPTARDVMIQRHWELSNTFEHYGLGGFGMMGWDPLKHVDTLRLFHFEELEVPQLREQMLDPLLRQIYALAEEEGLVSVEAVRYAVANQTAARFSDLDRVIQRLVKEKELEIRSPDGKIRTRPRKRLEPHDLIAPPEALIFPAWSRLGDLHQ